MRGQWGKLFGWFIASLVVSAAVTLLLPMIGGGSWMPDRISAEASSIDDLFWGLVVLCLIIFAIVSSIIVYSLLHFRAEPGDLTDGEHIHGNARMEVVWIVIPTIIVTVISILSWRVLQKNEIGLFDPAKAKDKGAALMQVDVHAFSFGWAFRYKDTDGNMLTQSGVEPTTDLVLPAHVTVRFNVLSCSGKEAIQRVREQEFRRLGAHGEKNEFQEIDPGICEKEWDATTQEQRDTAVKTAQLVFQAKEKRAKGETPTDEEAAALDAEPTFRGDQQFIDVNHAFWVPEARLKIDAISGLRTYVQWEGNRVTTPKENYQVVCAELCGSGHNAMRTPMCVVSESNFEWYLGLDAEAAKQATCVNLRLLSCFEQEPADRNDALSKLATLSQDKPDATCEDAKETVA